MRVRERGSIGTEGRLPPRSRFVLPLSAPGVLLSGLVAFRWKHCPGCRSEAGRKLTSASAERGSIGTEWGGPPRLLTIVPALSLSGLVAFRGRNRRDQTGISFL